MIRIEDGKIRMMGSGKDLIGEMGKLMNAFASLVFWRLPKELQERAMHRLLDAALEAELEGEEYSTVRGADEEFPEYEFEMMRKVFEKGEKQDDHQQKEI